jgi:hypothetical protein
MWRWTTFIPPRHAASAAQRGLFFIRRVHFDFGIANFNADEFRARLSERHLKFSDKTSQESFKFYDPDGFQVQVNGSDYVGHVS